MSESSVSQGADEARGLGLEHLVATKLLPPREAGRAVPRERLLTQLLEARRRRCFVVQGPAGCGKTTALVAWRQALMPLGFDVAWLALAPDDNEPTRLLDYLLASLAQVDPAITREASLLAGRGIDPEAVERTIVALVRGVARHQRELLLVIDDVHHLTDGRIHEALQWLLDYSPANLHLALVSRSAVPMSLARLRAQGLVLELDLRDLRFSPAESEQFLRAQLGRIDRRDALRLHELTDGWVAGLQLLSVDWKKKRQQPRGAAAVDDAPARGQVHVQDPRAFAAYFEREVLARLSAAELDLLACVSACTRFCAPLCAALVGTPDEVARADAILARLEADNLFIVQVEGATREAWYRLHPLLRETLRASFEQRGEAGMRRVHETAWHWFRDHGHLDEAVRHAVLAGETGAAADMVEQSAHRLAVRGELRMLIGLVRQLRSDEVQKRIGLRLWMNRLHLFARELGACAAGIARLDADIPAERVAERYALTLMRASLAVQRDDTDGAMKILPELLAAPPGADAHAIGGRNNILSWLYMHRGEYEHARRIQLDSPRLLIDGAPLLGTASGSLQGRCLVGLSHALEGQMTRAERVYRDVLYEAERCGSACAEPSFLAAALLGEVLYELDETQAALQLLEDRVDVLERVSIPDSVVRVLVVLAGAHWLGGRRLEAFAYLDRLEEYATNLGLDRLLAHSLGEQAHRHLQTGEFEAAHAILLRLEAIAARHASAERSALSEIPVIAQRARIRWCLVHGDLEGAAARVAPLIALCEASGRQRVIAQAQLQSAVIEQRRGRDASAHRLALEALRRGHRLGLVRSLLDADPGVLDLIGRVATVEGFDPVLAYYVEHLQSMRGADPTGDAVRPKTTGAAPAGAPRVEALSEREADVVRLLAQAMPNKKIARALGLSHETVKWHLKNVYGKLGVGSRDEAVARIRDLTLDSGAR